MDAREIESRTLKPFLHECLDEYALCLKNIPGFLDVEARMQAVHRRLAEVFMQEGDYYARLPNLRRIGLAYDCYKRALEHDPGMERLAKALPQIEKLFALKRRMGVRVDVAGKGDFPKRVSAELVAAIREKGYPDADVALGRVDTLHGQYDQSVRSIGADLGLELHDLDVPYAIFQIEGQVQRDFASKTGADKPIQITSSYTSHTQAVDNPEHLDAVVQHDVWRAANSAAGAEAAALSRDVAHTQSVRDRRAREHGTAVAALANKQKEQANLYNAARAHASQGSSLDSEAASAMRQARMASAQGNGQLAARNQARAQQLAAQANNERRIAANLNAQANALQPAINQLKGVENAARRALNSAESHFRAASGALAAAVARTAAAAKEASRWQSRVRATSPQIRKGIATSYSFKRHMMQVFGRVKTTLRVVAEHGQVVMARPACDQFDLEDQIVDTDVGKTDINGNRNGSDKLPSADTMQERLRGRAIAELASQLHDFFLKRHRDRFYAAARQHLKDGREIAAAESYAAFLACESNSREAEEARAFLDKLARKHLK